jgi:hypothetical protein
MITEYDDKGKIFTDVISKTPVFATVQTQLHSIHGQIHVRHDERLKDELDRDELFLAMTQVTVQDLKGQALYQTNFLAVRRAQIIWVLPDEDLIKNFKEKSQS